jgi:formylmethanofuran dehydrogenase subunit C
MRTPFDDSSPEANAAMILTLRNQQPLPVEVEGFTPDWAREKSLAEIERFQVFQGNYKLPLVEFFSIEGDAADGVMIFRGDLINIHWLGAHMTSGEVRIEGNAGRHVGSQMRGGKVTVTGHCSEYAGAEMRGGVLRVHGDSGILTGGAYRGSTKGMTGGTILIHGSAGDECGSLMRRGLIASS